MTKKQKAAAAWVVVIIAFLGGCALANVQNKVPPCIDVMMAYFDIGPTDAGWLTSVFTIMGMITAIPASWLMRKFGAKWIGVISLGCAAVGSLIGVFSTDLVLLMASRVIEGVGVGIIAVVGPALISMWFPPAKRGLPMGLWGSWMMVSQTLLFFLAGGVTMAFGWQGVWWFTFAFCVIVLVLYTWKVDMPPAGVQNYADAEDESSYSFAQGFKSPSTWVLTAVGVIFTFCCFGFATYISLYWAEMFYGGDMNPSNWWVAVMYALEIPIVILIGWMLNHVRLGRRRLVGVIGFALYSVILFLCFRVDNPALILPFIIIYPFLEGSIPTVYWTLCPSTARRPEYAGVALGVLNVGLNIGTLLGPPVTGYFIENYGWAMATIPLAAASILGAILFFFVKTYDHGIGAASADLHGAVAEAGDEACGIPVAEDKGVLA
jgi:predicted MFS family arabinose efflux permease